MATELTGLMSMCTNQSCLSGHNFGGCLATIAKEGEINNSCYTRFERTSPRWLPTSNARASLPIDSKVQDVAGPDSVSFWGADRDHSKRTHSGANELFRPFLASLLRARRSTPSAIREFRGGDAPFPPAPATDFQRSSDTQLNF